LHREIYMLRYLAQLLGRQRQQLLVCEGPAWDYKTYLSIKFQIRELL
jgi:hypothetical protein